MIKSTLLFFGLLLLLSPLPAQEIFKEPLSPRIANYRFDVQLNPHEKRLSGTEILRWRNASDRPVRELRFHLYMNAFRNPKSTFLRNRTLRHKRFARVDYKRLGGIDISQMTLADGTELTDSIRFIQPDDSNRYDSTVIRVPLPRAVPPGGTIELTIDFSVKLPKMIARTGYAKQFFLLGQWFPKIGVLEKNGRWNCHQFFPNTEFFADFGVYDVRLTLPREFKVGATGILTGRQETDSLQTLSFHAEDVHDFALTAWPKFRQEVRNIGNTRVSLLYAPEHQDNVERYFQSISHSLEFMGQWLMPYPYPNLTLVDMPMYAMAASGMEYPCFITCGSVRGLPSGIKLFPEGVTVHEFCHQYFYGMVANNEFEEAWLDEGFTSYATNKIMEKYYGVHTSLFNLLGIHAGDYDEHKKSYLRKPDTDIIVKPAWEFRMGGYGTYEYDKPVLMLKTLEEYLGSRVMNRIMLTYVERWKFRHPHTQDFVDVVNETAPANMDWFLRPALYGTDILDYAVQRISVRREAAGPDSSVYRSRVEIKRKGTFVFPQEIQMIFSDGDTLTEHWDGKAPYRIYTYRRPNARVVSAQLNPRQRVWLDLDWTNNSFTRQDNPDAFLKHWVQSLKIYQHLLLSLFSI